MRTDKTVTTGPSNITDSKTKSGKLALREQYKTVKNYFLINYN